MLQRRAVRFSRKHDGNNTTKMLEQTAKLA